MSKICTFKDLSDGTYTMDDVWTMNDWLDLNQYVEAKSQEDNNG